MSYRRTGSARRVVRVAGRAWCWPGRERWRDLTTERASNPNVLRANHTAVQSPDGGPGTVERVVRERVARSLILIEIDAKTWGFGCPHRAVVDFRCAREDPNRSFA